MKLVVVTFDEWQAKDRYIEQLEDEIDRLRNEYDMLQEQLEQRRCYA